MLLTIEFLSATIDFWSKYMISHSKVNSRKKFDDTIHFQSTIYFRLQFTCTWSGSKTIVWLVLMYLIFWQIKINQRERFRNLSKKKQLCKLLENQMQFSQRKWLFRSANKRVICCFRFWFKKIVQYLILQDYKLFYCSEQGTWRRNQISLVINLVLFNITWKLSVSFFESRLYVRN